MGRPAKGYVSRNPKLGVWEVRVTLLSGKRSSPVTLPKVGPCIENAESPPKDCACKSCKLAEAIGQRTSLRMRAGEAQQAAVLELVSEWFGRYFTWKEKFAKRKESIADSRRIFKNWIEPSLGSLAMVNVRREDLERFSEFLDEQVAEERIAWKTAVNIWAEISAGFNFAVSGKSKNGKNLALRVLDSNPAQHAAGPSEGIEKDKPFLFPAEIVKLLSCDGPKGIPLERRHVYAVAIYTAARQAELRALRVADVDLVTMQVRISKQLRDGVEKERTKNGRGRTITIEPNLVPLLRLLTEGRDASERLLSVGGRNRCSTQLREDLLLAGVDRAALHIETATHAHLTFHNLKDTCGTHMAVRRDPPQDIQWRLAHADAKTTQIYIANAKREAGPAFGTPLDVLPAAVLQPCPPDGKRGHSEGNTPVAVVESPIAEPPIKQAMRHAAHAKRVDFARDSIPGASTTERSCAPRSRARLRSRARDPGHAWRTTRQTRIVQAALSRATKAARLRRPGEVPFRSRPCRSRSRRMTSSCRARGLAWSASVLSATA